MDLIDIGANLTHDSFDHDRDAVMARAREAGVVQMVVTGASREHSPMALKLAKQHPGELFATAGVHPHHASEYTTECDAEMRELHAHSEVVAVVVEGVVGEVGADIDQIHARSLAEPQSLLTTLPWTAPGPWVASQWLPCGGARLDLAISKARRRAAPPGGHWNATRATERSCAGS